jgi:DNA polymerase-4
LRRDGKKPDGLTVIPPDRVEPFLQRLPVDALWGVGPVTAEKLRARGILRLVDVRTFDDHALRQAVGSMADWLKQLAKGVDDRPVVAHRETKSSGSENTYPEDLRDIETIRKGDRGDGAARRCLARAASAVGPHGHDKSPLLGFHHCHPQSYSRTSRDAANCRQELCSCSKGRLQDNGPSGCLG